VEENTRAWIAQSRLALSKLTAAVDKLPVETARPPEAAVAAPVPSVAPTPPPTASPTAPSTAPVAAGTAPAAPAPAAATPFRPAPARNGPTTLDHGDDERPAWAAAEQPRPSSTLDHCEYLIVTPADRPAPPPAPVAADPEVAYEPDPDAFDDDDYMREPVDESAAEADGTAAGQDSEPGDEEPAPEAAAEAPAEIGGEDEPLLAAGGGGAPVRAEHGVSKRRRARRR
jgi:hypothetical protein